MVSCVPPPPSCRRDHWFPTDLPHLTHVNINRTTASSQSLRNQVTRLVYMRGFILEKTPRTNQRNPHAQFPKKSETRFYVFRFLLKFGLHFHSSKPNNV